ncbi:hypothetical protein [Kluyvera georgiana]|nr:hypothetical protein [Kluyvera georgiana]
MNEITKQKAFLPAAKMPVLVYADKTKPLSDMVLQHEYITKH